MHFPRERLLWLGVTLVLSLLLLRDPAQSRPFPAAPLPGAGVAQAAQPSAPAKQTRVYHNTLKELSDRPPLLADHPEFIEPVIEQRRFEAPPLVHDDGADLSVRAWRFSYNARGIIEIPNHLRAAETAVIMVHPWGIDDNQGWTTPEPAGIADFCTPDKNHLAARHTREVIDPFLKAMRGHVKLVGYSLIGERDPLRMKMYRTIYDNPSASDRSVARDQVLKRLRDFKYQGGPLIDKIPVSVEFPVRDYFAQFGGTDASERYNPPGFWKLPVPVTSDVTVHPEDVLFFDVDGYPPLRDFLKRQGVRHVLLTGYATDMCFCRTTAGYENLSKDFNVFLVGDASLATYPANNTPRFATNAHISFASLTQLVTQVSWIKKQESQDGEGAGR